MTFYNDAQFGFRQRKWFGLGSKWGGDAPAQSQATDPDTIRAVDRYKAGGFGLGTHDPGTLTHVEKWYPQGPIQIKKVGVFVCSTVNNASGGYPNFQFLTRGASGSVAATVQFSSCTANEGTFAASKSTITVNQVKAGEYMTIKSYEPTTPASATEVKATTSGRVAFFVDYVPKYDPDRWGQG